MDGNLSPVQRRPSFCTWSAIMMAERFVWRLRSSRPTQTAATTTNEAKITMCIVLSHILHSFALRALCAKPSWRLKLVSTSDAFTCKNRANVDESIHFNELTSTRRAAWTGVVISIDSHKRMKLTPPMRRWNYADTWAAMWPK